MKSIIDKINNILNDGKNDANETYKTRYNSIQKKMKVLQKKLKNHSIQQDKDPLNWGFAGSLSHVEEELDEIIKFLN